MSEVFARTSGARQAREGETARTFVVKLRRTGRRVTGSLVIRETNGTTIARTVQGAVCSDVATVLALATALAIDPRAELSSRQTLEDAPKPEAPDPETPPPSAHAPAEPQASTETERSSEGAWTPRLSLGGRVQFGGAPRAAVGGSALIALTRRPSTLLDEVGLELSYVHAPSQSVLDAEAAFDFFLLRPTLCNSAFEIGASLRAGPCLAAEVGLVRGIGSAIPTAWKQSRFWAVAELLFRSELSLSRGWFVSLEGGLGLPWTRYRFLFQNPDTSIHQVPWVTGSAALRVGTSF